MQGDSTYSANRPASIMTLKDRRGTVHLKTPSQYQHLESRPGSNYRDKWANEGPMTTITPEIRLAIEQAGEQPVQLTDPQTNLVYFIVRADVYERMRASRDDFDVRDAYSLMDQVAAREGWDDPSMDVYNEYQPPAK
jgi:hypothetical protein